MAPEVVTATDTGTGGPIPMPALASATEDGKEPWDVEMTEPAEEPVGTNAPCITVRLSATVVAEPCGPTALANDGWAVRLSPASNRRFTSAYNSVART